MKGTAVHITKGFTVLAVACCTAALLVVSCFSRHERGRPWAKPEKPTVLEKQQYIEAVTRKQSDLTVSQSIGRFKFSVHYTPLHMQALLSTKGEKNRDSAVQDFIRRNENNLFFMMRIENTSNRTNDILKTVSGDASSYYKNLDYFSFHIQHDISLLVDKDTLPCMISHYQRGYDVTPGAVFVLVFESKRVNPDADMIFRYNDRFTGAGRLNFRFDSEKTNSLPVLSMK